MKQPGNAGKIVEATSEQPVEGSNRYAVALRLRGGQERESRNVSSDAVFFCLSNYISGLGDLALE
ncbi:MAG: hypothetical protein P4K83_02305 [Terracidiphilus sp.]|nr:hypothetical protein [Terracidiphilus sp.]